MAYNTSKRSFVRTAQVCQLGLQGQRRHLPLISFNLCEFAGLPQISTKKDYATSLAWGLCVFLYFPCTFPRFRRLVVQKKITSGFDSLLSLDTNLTNYDGI